MHVVICNFPPMLKFYLPAAPAILAGACRWLKKSYVFLDFNHQDIDIERWSQQVLAYKPRILALSVFSYKSRDLAQQLINKIKATDPSIKIAVGGSGIKNSINGEILLSADYVVEDDGEYLWAKLLGSTEQFDNIDPPYLPDYSMYDLESYRQNGRIYVPVTGSRGCVRRCTFCEIHQHWEFTQRNPDKIAEEIRYILDLIPDAYVHFTDSLVNGSLPAFELLLDHLIKIKECYKDFSWGGQFIIRNKKQSDQRYWQKIAQSGNALLEIGVETGSDRLRKQMKKNFTNEDLTYSLEFMKQYNLKCVFLMFVGYPTETESDFDQTLQMLEKYQQYANNTITELQLGYNFSIHPGTPIYDTSNSDGIITTKDPIVWFNRTNPKLTFLTRCQRRQTLQDLAVSLGYKLSFDNDIAIADAETTYKKYQDIVNLIERQK